jgi:hypothetical protein
MRGKSKVFGSALAAILVLCATLAGAAQAEQSYHASGAPTTLSGSQVATTKIHIPGSGTIECTGVNLTGTLASSTSSLIEVHPSFSGCVAFGFATVHVTTTGCNFLFGTPVKNQANMAISCTGTNKITVTPTFFGASVCSVEFGTQQPAGSVDLANNAGKTDFLITATLSKIAHTSGCGGSNATDGEMTGSVTEVGSNSIWVE